MVLDLLLASYLVKGTALVTALALVLRARPKPAPVLIVALGTILFVLGLLWRLYQQGDPLLGFDYRIFREVGLDLRAGRDPYSADRFDAHPFLHPPTALPIFALFALAPFDVSFLVWTVLNVLACLVLLPGAHWALTTREQTEERQEEGKAIPWRLSLLTLLGLTAALVISDASLVSFYLGQLGMLEAVLLLLALGCQASGRHILAGVWLALATVKVATMLPFLLLFQRRADLRTWVALSVTVLGLCLVSGSPAGLPERCATILDRIKQLEAPGQVNDYSFNGTQSENILGFDHAFYRLGLRDRRVIRVAQYLALAVLGAWVTRQVLGKARLPRAAACSLVTLYSVVFLYHRNYDTVILVLPLVYSAGQARCSSGRRRYLFVGCAVAILLVWYLNKDLMRALQENSVKWGAWGWLVQAVVLPYATWLIVLAMIALVTATRLSAPRSPRGRDGIQDRHTPCSLPG